MGAENSILEGCDWGETYPCPNGFQWNISPVSKNDGMEAVVFQPKNSEKKDNLLLQKSAKMLKSLRHPNFVRFLGCGSSSDGFWLATEPVYSLLTVVNTVGISPEELVAGVSDILQALDFLHSKLGVCHNNICPASVYVSKDGSWKLGGMEHACKFLEATPDFLESIRAFRNEDCLAPEEKTGAVKVAIETAHARDVFAVAAMVDALMDFVTEKSPLVVDLEKQMIACVSPEPSSRPSTSTLICSPAFRSDFVNIVTFIKNVTVKTEEERKEFFGSLLPRLHQLPEEVIARRLAVPLLARFVLLDETAQEFVVPSLLKPRKDEHSKTEVEGLMSEALFQKHIIPYLCQVFQVHDCLIRLVLLQHFHAYVHLFSREQLEDEIFLQVLIGVRDTEDQLVAASLRALADLVPLLGGDFIIGGSRKCFFFHGMPKVVSSDQIEHSLAPAISSTSSILPAVSISVKKNSNSNHPSPLLKDIAAGRDSGVISSQTTTEEKERKMREREQRREEARLKREERKLKAKAQRMMKTETIADKKDDRDKLASSHTSEILDSSVHEEKLASFSHIESWEDEEKGDGLYSTQKQDAEEEKEASENEETKADWSDWEDAGGNISDEIEEELKNMSDSSTSENKVQTSPNPYENDDTLNRLPPMKVDWSDVTLNVQANNHTDTKDSKGPLSLGRKNLSKNNGDGIVEKEGKNIPSDWGDDDWNSEDKKDDNTVTGLDNSLLPSTHAKALKLKSSSSSTLSSNSAGGKSAPKKTPPRVSDDLGSGYDIKSIEIKSKSSLPPEEDLFADMAPVISTSSTSNSLKDSIDMGRTTAVDNVRSRMATEAIDAHLEQTKPSMSSSLFNVDTNSHEEVDGGWGDEDEGWGTEDF